MSADLSNPRLQKLSQYLPSVVWLGTYQKAWLRADLIGGLTLAAYLLPAGIGDASLAGLRPEAGMYACLFSGLIFWLFCSSHYTAITITSAISLLIGSSLGGLYFNIENVREAVLIRIRNEPKAPKLVVCDLSASPYLDLHGAKAIGALVDELANTGVRFQVVEAHAVVRDRLRAEGLDEKLGGIDRFRSVAQVIEDFERKPVVGQSKTAG
jgi:MFS superfamily sulfate permease-like transporter